MSDLFTYEHAKVPDDCKYIISPSQIYKFFEYPKIWYLENIKGDKPEFNGNTSTYIGTICHYIYKCVAEQKPVDKISINEELLEHLRMNPNPDVDSVEVMDIYPKVVNTVVNEYVLTHARSNVLCEQPITCKVADGIYIAGTYDRLEDTVLCDYKNVSTKPNSTAIPFHYKIQLLTYAYALRQQGKEVDRIRIIYGVKPTKTIPARCIEVTEMIDDESWKLVEDTLNLISDSILTVEKNPELTYLIFKSMELKENA